MNFIFPSNYKFKNKLLGFIDYTTAIVNIIWYAFVYSIINLIFNNLNIKIFLFIILCLPFFILSIVGIHKENIISVTIYITKFFSRSRIYFNKKY